MEDKEYAYAIALIKQAIATLEQPVQYTADVHKPKELTNRVPILRADAAFAKKSLEKAVDVLEKAFAVFVKEESK